MIINILLPTLAFTALSQVSIDRNLAIFPLAIPRARAGVDLRLLQKTMGHASITVTAHIYADLDDDELDDVASGLDAHDYRNVGHV